MTQPRVLMVKAPHWIEVAAPIATYLPIALVAGFSGVALLRIVGTLPLVFFTLQAIIHYLTTRLTLSTFGMQFQTGLLWKSRVSLGYNRIETVEYDQSPIGQLLRYGTVRLIGAGGSTTEVRFIPNPQELVDKYHEALSLPKA